MAKEYTLQEFTDLIKHAAEHKVDPMCNGVMRYAQDTFLDEVIKRTPVHNGNYEFPAGFEELGYEKSADGLRKGWEANRNAPITRTPRMYITTLTNKAKSHYISGHTGKSRTDYYAYYVDNGHRITGGYKPYLDAVVKPQYKQGVNFTDEAIAAAEPKINRVAGKALDKFIDGVFK